MGLDITIELEYIDENGNRKRDLVDYSPRMVDIWDELWNMASEKQNLPKYYKFGDSASCTIEEYRVALLRADAACDTVYDSDTFDAEGNFTWDTPYTDIYKKGKDLPHCRVVFTFD